MTEINKVGRFEVGDVICQQISKHYMNNYYSYAFFTICEKIIEIIEIKEYEDKEIRILYSLTFGAYVDDSIPLWHKYTEREIILNFKTKYLLLEKE